MFMVCACKRWDAILAIGRDIVIALDAMGGDYGPGVVLRAASLALKQRADVRFLLFGQDTLLAPILASDPLLAAKSELCHCDVAIKMTDKPSQALRYGRRVSSMWRAVEAVKSGKADCAVSAGNTGALMAMAKFCLHMLAGVERPALAALWPTLRGDSLVLDVGASIGADSRHLMLMAIMGAAMARIILGIPVPTVGLINVGVEDIKGLENIREAGRLLREHPLPHMDYRGFVEGGDLGLGTVDVFVTEGFTGNIALKTAEGTAKQIRHYIREALGSSLAARIGYLFARKALSALQRKLDPGRLNGAVFLGLDGIVIKSHGGADARSYAHAIGVGYDMVQQSLLANIRDMIEPRE